MDGLLYNKCGENARDGGRGISQATWGRHPLRRFAPAPLAQGSQGTAAPLAFPFGEGAPPQWQMRSILVSQITCRALISLASLDSFPPRGKPRGGTTKAALTDGFWLFFLMAFVFHRAALAGGGAALVFDRRAQGEDEGNGDNGDEYPVDGFHIRTTPRSA